MTEAKREGTARIDPLLKSHPSVGRTVGRELIPGQSGADTDSGGCRCHHDHASLRTSVDDTETRRALCPARFVCGHVNPKGTTIASLMTATSGLFKDRIEKGYLRLRPSGARLQNTDGGRHTPGGVQQLLRQHTVGLNDLRDTPRPSRLVARAHTGPGVAVEIF